MKLGKMFLISLQKLFLFSKKSKFRILDIQISYWVTSRVSLTSWGEGASLALVDHPSSDGVTIKMPYGVDVLHRPASHPIFSYWVG